jgi:two-component system, cell cycle sensor histidine kinase and response regulator CckA
MPLFQIEHVDCSFKPSPKSQEGDAVSQIMVEESKLQGVLVVDDEPLVLKYTTAVICGLGYQKVLRAENVAAARAVLVAESLSLIIADVSLPDGDGRQLLAEALELHPQAAGVLITGFSSEDLKLPEALAGRVLFLQKPFTADDISHVLCELIERRVHPALSVHV